MSLYLSRVHMYVVDSKGIIFYYDENALTLEIFKIALNAFNALKFVTIFRDIHWAMSWPKNHIYGWIVIFTLILIVERITGLNFMLDS